MNMEENKENKKKKRSPRRIIGMVIILVGIAVCAYPFVVQAYNKYQQEKMLEEFKEEIKKNQEIMADSQKVTDTPEPTEAVMPEPTKEATPEPTTAEATPKVGETDSQKTSITPEPTEAVMPEPTKEAIPEPTTAEATPEVGETDSQKASITPEPTEAVPTEAPTPTPKGNRLNNQEVIGIIEIDAIDLIYPIVEGADHAEIGVAIGHMTETAAIGEIGNCALAGHRGGYSGPYFKDVHKLVAGDIIRLTNELGKEFEYEVTESMVVAPTDVWVVEDTGEGKAVLTLVTCEDNGTQRLIIRAYLKEK